MQDYGCHRNQKKKTLKILSETTGMGRGLFSLVQAVMIRKGGGGGGGGGGVGGGGGGGGVADAGQKHDRALIVE